MRLVHSKRLVGNNENMVSDLHPTVTSQARAEPVTDPHPTGNFKRCIDSFILAGRVEGKTDGTNRNYRQQMDAFRKFLEHQHGPLNLEQVTVDDIRLFLLSTKENGVSPFTVQTYYKNLKAFFNWFVTEGLLEKNPMEHIKTPKVPRLIIKPLTNEDIKNVLLVCSSSDNLFRNLRNTAIVLVFLDTALRLEELANIRMKDIDIESGTIKVMGKGAKERIVRVGSYTQRAILKYLLKREGDCEYLWVTDDGRHYMKNIIQLMVKRLLHRAEVSTKKHGPHIFRHTAAINFLRNGGDVFTLQVMLGHSTLEMTRKYVSSLGAEDLFRAHEKASPVDNLLKIY